VAHIARNMGLARQSVQRVVNELVADGLVEFAPNPHHRRASLVRLTDAGMAAYRAATARQVPWADDLAAGLDLDDIQVALRVARELVRRLETTAATRMEGRGT
jgi:DNA-binding MarR family transcriptional regulator